MQSTRNYDEKLIAIAEVLLQRTLDDRLNWTAIGDDAVALSLPGASVEISDYGYGRRYLLSVRDDKRRVVRNIISSDLDTFHDTFARLYEKARNKALKTDHVLDSILDHFDPENAV